MAGTDVSPAKAILLAVQLAAAVDLPSFESLVSRYPKTLHKELALRILLTYLPEILETSEYISLLGRLEARELENNPDFKPAEFGLEELDEIEAKKKARKLRLLALEPPYDLADEDTSPLIRFLVLRALRIDENTGLITQIPELLQPFLHLSTYLRTWIISTILPLLRFNYEYHIDDGIPLTIPKFERLDDEAGVKLLLSKTAHVEEDAENTVGRDLRGLVGPWMYGDTRWKRRKSRLGSQAGLQHSMHFDQNPISNEKCIGWEEVFQWITRQAGSSWRTAVDAIEQWDGPGDVDVGDYSDGSIWLDEDEQQLLERRYARAALAAAYLISEESEDALNGVYRILERLIKLMDQDRVPSLQAACSLLMPILFQDEEFPSPKHAQYLRNNLLGEENSLTRPGEISVQVLHALVISAYLCTRIGSGFTVRRAGELALLQDEAEQKIEFSKLLVNVRNGPKGDDKYWIKLRNEILWLRSWGVEESAEGTDASTGRGILGKLSKEYIEAELLNLLLSNTRYTLARSIYEKSPDRPLSKKALEDTVISAAMNAYDNATNPNKTRGGVKKCQDILQAFPDTLSDSLRSRQLESLIKATHSLEHYRLVFKQGESFKPVTLRVHGDPISIIGKVLDQNEKSYLKIVDFINIGRDMVKAGITMRNVDGSSIMTEEDVEGQSLISDKRVVSMCIAAALAEDDFETAYSYVVTRLKKTGGPAQSRSLNVGHNEAGLTAEILPKGIDDWSWLAALEAGKYRRNANTVSINGSGSNNVRHLEQRIECLAQALRLAPKSTLQDILNAYRRCEEELEAAVKLEAEQEALWDIQGDDQFMPGGFNSTLAKQNTSNTNARTTEEAPMSLFDLSKASMARAQTGFSALSRLRGSETESGTPGSVTSVGTDGSRDDAGRTRKRDQVKNLAVGGLASGIGWLINAPVPVQQEGNDEER